MSILVLTSDTLIGTPATGNIEYNGQFFGTDSNASRAQMQRIARATAVASTSGTSIDFTGIPAWVEKITVMFQGVSTNGTSNIQIQLGTGSTTYTTSGYLGSTTTVAQGSTGCSNISTGFTCGAGNQAATTVMHGSCIITNITGNTWVANGNFGKSDGTQLNTVGGSIALAATLTAVRVTANGTDTFDAGSINIIYEG